MSSPPAIPTGVPSEILERRPDVATSERQMAFENAQVGIAMTAFYPHITLAGSGGGKAATSPRWPALPARCGRWVEMCSSQFLMAAAIAPTWH